MKTTTKCESKHRKRGLLLSLLWVAPYVTAYDSAYYYPTGNSVRDYWGYYQAYPYQDVPNGPRYRIIAGQHVYEPYYYGTYSSY